MEFEQLRHNDHLITYTKQALHIHPHATATMLHLIKKWQGVFPREDTFVQREYGVPSLMVRFDCVVDAKGTVQVYEIQEGCGGAGYAGIINDTFRKVRNNFKKKVWPEFKLLTHQSHSDHDDDLWLKQIGMKKALATDCLLQIRHPLRQVSDAERATLIARSVKPWAFHSDKQYGVSLGLWNTISWGESAKGASLPWDEGFALKPLHGYGSKDVMLWNPAEKKGRATRTQICATLEKNETMCLQPFIPPIAIPVNGAPYHGVLRPFFGYNPARKQWESMGGIWIARPYPNLRIHGAPDSIMGPLYTS